MTMILADSATRVSMHRGESRFRRMPTVPYILERAKECEMTTFGEDHLVGTGHILTVRDNKIVCVDCGAEWQDFGC